MSYSIFRGSKSGRWDQLKGYRHPTALDFTTITKTYPELEFDGLNISTVPLDQGVATAIGIAMSNIILRATFNRPGVEVISSVVYCTLGDACLQEGVALEVASFNALQTQLSH